MCCVSSVTSTVPTKFVKSIDGRVASIQDTLMNNRQIANALKSIIEQLSNLLSDISYQSGDTPEAKEAKVKAEKGICCYCGDKHDDTEVFRGDHERCYKKVMRAIAQKVVTEEQAISRGWILPRDPGGRKRDADDPIAQVIKSKSAKTKQPRKSQG